MYAALFVVAAAAVVVPSPAEVNWAEQLIRFPELEVGAVAPRDRLAARAAALRLEVMGAGEFLCWDARADENDPDATAAGYALIRALFADLRDCPPLSEAGRLPSSAWCDQATGWNRGLAATLRNRIKWEIEYADRLEAAAAEADRYANFWNEASYANWTGCTTHRRRQALRFVRDAVGAEAWERSELPESGPFHLLTPRR